MTRIHALENYLNPWLGSVPQINASDQLHGSVTWISCDGPRLEKLGSMTQISNLTQWLRSMIRNNNSDQCLRTLSRITATVFSRPCQNPSWTPYSPPWIPAPSRAHQSHSFQFSPYLQNPGSFLKNWNVNCNVRGLKQDMSKEKEDLLHVPYIHWLYYFSK